MADKIECSVDDLYEEYADGLRRVELSVYRDYERFVPKPKPRTETVDITIIMKPSGDRYSGYLRTYPPTGSVYLCSPLKSSTWKKARLAEVLKRNGIRPGERIWVSVENRIEWTIGRKAGL